MSFQADKTIVLRSIPLLPDALQWCPGDTHLVAVTHSHLHLLSPSPCASHFTIVTLPPPILLASPSNSDPAHSQSQSQAESRTRPLLPRDTKADSLVLPGDVLPSAWRLARWSPRSASGLGSILAAVDYAGRLVLYAKVLARAGAGAGAGAGGPLGAGGSDSWRLIQDWTPLVSHHLYLARRVRRSAVEPAVRGVKVTPRDAMVVSLAWRPNLLNHNDDDNNKYYKSDNDMAVLAVGTMAGHVSVWICDMQTGHGEPVAMWHLASLNDTVNKNQTDGDDGNDEKDESVTTDQSFNKPSTLPWVTLLSWSPNGDYLAYALSNGEFGVLHTTFSPPVTVPEPTPAPASESDPVMSPPPPTWSITALPQGRLFAANDPSQHDPRTVTAIAWCSPTHVALAKGAAAIVLWDVTDPASIVETPLVAPDGASSFVSNVNALVPLVPGYTQGLLGVQAFTVDGHVFVVSVTGEVRRDLAWLARRGFLGKHGIELPEDWRLGGGGGGRAAGARGQEDAADDENEYENDQDGKEDGDDGEGEGEGDGGDLKVPGLDNKMVRYHGAATSKNGVVTAVLYTIFPTNELIYRTERFTNTYLDLFLTPVIPVSSDPLSPLMTRLESALSTSALTIGTRALLWDVVYVTNLHPEWKPIVLDAMHTWLAASSASIGGDTRIQRRLEQWMLMLHASATSNPKTAPTNSANTVRNLAVGLLVSYWLTTLGHGQQPALVVLRVCALVRALLRPPLLDAACAAGLADLATVCAQGLGDEADDKVRAWCRWLLSLAEKLRANGSSAMTDKDAIEASTELVLVDPCPVCGETADVLVDPESVGLISLCKNKHRMTRCCLTLAILATPKCRACTGCTKTKAAPAAAVESADNTCPMCGDRLLWSGRVPLALPPLPIPTLANPLAMGESDSDADAAAKTPAKRGRKPKSLGGSASGTSSPVPRPADASDDDKGDDGRGTPASAKAHRSAAKPKVLTEPLDMDKISRALEAERAKKGKRRATAGIPLDGDEAEGAAAGDGSVKKRRGRPPKNKKKDKQDAGEADADAEGEGEGEGEQEENGQSASVTATPTPTPKRRGRPPKNLAAAAPATTTAPDTEGVVAGTEPKRRVRPPKTPATPVPTEPKRRGRPSKAKTPTTGAAATVDAQTLVDESAKDQAQQPQINPTSAAVALMALATSAGSGEQQAGIAPPETPSARGGRGRGRGAPASSSLTASTARVAESGAAGDGRSESIEQGKDADGDVVMDDS